VRSCMGRAGRAWVIERFVNARVLGLTVRFYRQVLDPASAQKDVAVFATDAATVGD
jgi:hypothetical protein